MDHGADRSLKKDSTICSKKIHKDRLTFIELHEFANSYRCNIRNRPCACNTCKTRAQDVGLLLSSVARVPPDIIRSKLDLSPDFSRRRGFPRTRRRSWVKCREISQAVYFRFDQAEDQRPLASLSHPPLVCLPRIHRALYIARLPRPRLIYFFPRLEFSPLSRHRIQLFPLVRLRRAIE